MYMKTSTFSYYNLNTPNFNIKIGKDTIFTNTFQDYLLPTFITLKFFKFCIQLTINSMKVQMFS
jgi:hypothetical protein